MLHDKKSSLIAILTVVEQLPTAGLVASGQMLMMLLGVSQREASSAIVCALTHNGGDAEKAEAIYNDLVTDS